MMKFLRLLVSLILGVFITRFFMTTLHVTPVVASALTGLIGSLSFYKKFNLPNDIGIAMYCGSFIGMGNVLNTWELVLASCSATFLLFLLQNLFKGFGGKLGMIAYVASVFTGELFFASNADVSIRQVLQGVSLVGVAPVVLGSLLGFYTTIYLHHYKQKSAVFASALPSFLVGLLTFTSLPNVSLFIITFFSASFIGMMMKNLMHTNYYFLLILVHSLSMLFLYPILGGYGGALGTIAFFSVSVLYGVEVLRTKLVHKKTS